MSSALQPGFMMIHSNKPELLQQLLVRWYQTHPLDALEDEVILVHSNGIAQWLKIAMASPSNNTSGLGIAANIDMVLPSSFIWRLYQAVLGEDQVKTLSPFSKDQLLWRLMRLLPELLDDEDFFPLRHFLKNDKERRKHYQLAEKMADLFDQYQVYRADWLNAWEQGQYIIHDIKNQTQDLAADQIWQAKLWQRLLQDMGNTRQFSRAVTHQLYLKKVQTLQDRPNHVPRRITVFGVSSLPYQSLEALHQIAKFSQVLLCVHNPCEHYWTQFDVTKAQRSRFRQRLKPTMPLQLNDDELYLHHHPLLNTWGRQGKDYLSLLDNFDNIDTYRDYFTQHHERIDMFESHGEDTLLQQLQEDIRLLRSYQESQHHWSPISPEDQSICFQITHSAQREIEILHDYLLDKLDRDPNLHPKDIIVMLPDVNQYAPHIQAVFGRSSRTDKRHIPFSIADQHARQQVPLATAFEFLLTISDSRINVSQLLDLLDVKAVQDHFKLDTNAIELLKNWISDTQIRWGINIQHRAQFSNYPFEENSWIFGLKQMLLGYAIGSDHSGFESRHWQGIEAYGEVAGISSEHAGALAKLINQLEAWLLLCQQEHTPSQWATHIQALLKQFFTVTEIRDELVLQSLQKIISSWSEACVNADFECPLPLRTVADHCLKQLDQPSLSQRFIAGQLTFATLMPMRAIPFKMVCLLGMNDGDFPRSRTPIDFDLMNLEHRPGDRSRREDDRYLYLEAILSAREQLYISWIGRSILDNTERPASVLVNQLRDHLSQTWQVSGAEDNPKALLEQLTLEHFLQPFNPKYLNDGNPSAYFTYAREWEAQTQDSHGLTNAHQAFPNLGKEQLPTGLTISELSQFLKNPCQTFFNKRLDIYLPRATVDILDHEPFALNGLNKWAIMSTLMRSWQHSWESASNTDQADRAWNDSLSKLDQLTRQGFFPVAQSRALAQEEMLTHLREITDLYQQELKVLNKITLSQDVSHTIQTPTHQLELRGQLPALYHDVMLDIHVTLQMTASAVIKTGHYQLDKFLQQWIQHLILNSLHGPTRTIVISNKGKLCIREIHDKTYATELLTDLCQAYLENLNSPLPVAPKSSQAWLMRKGREDELPLDMSTAPESSKKAREIYEGTQNYEGEKTQSPYYPLIYPDFETLWSAGGFNQWSIRLYSVFNEQIIRSDKKDNQ